MHRVFRIYGMRAYNYPGKAIVVLLTDSVPVLPLVFPQGNTASYHYSRVVNIGNAIEGMTEDTLRRVRNIVING